jgi:hypothetical protein
MAIWRVRSLNIATPRGFFVLPSIKEMAFLDPE